MEGVHESGREKDLPRGRTSRRNLKADAQRALVPCQALFFGVGMNDSRLVGRLLSVSQPEFHELTQH